MPSSYFIAKQQPSALGSHRKAEIHKSLKLCHILKLNIQVEGFPSGSVVKNPPALQELQDTLVLFLGLEDPLKEEMVTNSGILA